MQTTATNLVRKLQNAGFKAYFAGGAVRDMLLGREAKDIDIATSAKPQEIRGLFSKTIPIGEKFGVILASEKGHHFEIATFRSDSGYSDGRRPDYVTFSDAKEDVLRRDFTINGIFYDPVKNEFIDYIGGREDLDKRIIRFIGNADERIKEDYLRILRAVRFKNKLNFQYDTETFKALKRNKRSVKNISSERNRDELNKILDDKSRYASLRDLDEAGILDLLFPELSKCKGVRQPKDYHMEGDVFEHSLLAVKTLPPKAPLFVVWAVLLHDIGKPDTFFEGKDRIHFNGHVFRSEELAKQILERLKFPNIERNIILWLVRNHMIVGDIPKMRKSKKRLFILDPKMKWLLRVHKADAMGSDPVDLSLYKKIKNLIEAERGKKIPRVILTGDDVIKVLGIKPGPQVGKYLQKIHHAQLEGKIRTKKEAIKFLKKG